MITSTHPELHRDTLTSTPNTANFPYLVCQIPHIPRASIRMISNPRLKNESQTHFSSTVGATIVGCLLRCCFFQNFAMLFFARP